MFQTEHATTTTTIGHRLDDILVDTGQFDIAGPINVKIFLVLFAKFFYPLFV
jgi:hypothetical protein